MELSKNAVHDAVAIRDKAREIFISCRAAEEQKFAGWYASLLKCSKERVLDKIPFDYTNMSIRSLIPEWYKDVPDPDVCAQQVKEANDKISKINEIIADLNREGQKLLEEYNALYSGR